MDYEIQFLESLLFTIAIETFLLVVLVRFLFKKSSITYWTLILSGIIASFATLPYVWFILPMILQDKNLYIIISELSVTIIEALIIIGFLKIDLKKAFILSILCNAISFGLGLILF